MNTQIPRDALIRDLSAVLAGVLHQPSETFPGRVAACRIRDVLGIGDGAFPSEIRPLLNAALDEDSEGCGCPFDYEYTCPACGHQRTTNHCPHDGIQNPCPQCGHTDPGKQTPLQFLGVTEPPGEGEGQR